MAGLPPDFKNFLMWENKSTDFGLQEINDFGEIRQISRDNNIDITTAYLHWKMKRNQDKKSNVTGPTTTPATTRKLSNAFTECIFI